MPTGRPPGCGQFEGEGPIYHASFKDSWAHKAHFRMGDGLVNALLNTMTTFFGGV